MKYLIVWIILGLVLVASLAYFLMRDPAPAARNEEPALSNTATCTEADPDIRRTIDAPYRELSEATAAGTATVSGQIVTIEQSIWGEQVTGVYLRVSSSSPPAFTEFNGARVERGNTVNRIKGGALLFKLGAMEDGTYTTTAAVSEQARQAIEEGGAVSLNLQMPVYAGSGAPANFTFACAITAA